MPQRDSETGKFVSSDVSGGKGSDEGVVEDLFAANDYEVQLCRFFGDLNADGSGSGVGDVRVRFPAIKGQLDRGQVAELVAWYPRKSSITVGDQPVSQGHVFVNYTFNLGQNVSAGDTSDRPDDLNDQGAGWSNSSTNSLGYWTLQEGRLMYHPGIEDETGGIHINSSGTGGFNQSQYPTHWRHDLGRGPIFHPGDDIVCGVNTSYGEMGGVPATVECSGMAVWDVFERESSRYLDIR